MNRSRVMKTLSATGYRRTRCLSKKIHLLQNRLLGRVQDTLMVAIRIGPIAAAAAATGRTPIIPWADIATWKRWQLPIHFSDVFISSVHALRPLRPDDRSSRNGAFERIGIDVSGAFILLPGHLKGITDNRYRRSIIFSKYEMHIYVTLIKIIISFCRIV